MTTTKIIRALKRSQASEDRAFDVLKYVFETKRLEKYALKGMKVEEVVSRLLRTTGVKVAPRDVSVFMRVNGYGESWGSYAIDMRACAAAAERPITKISTREGSHGFSSSRSKFGACIDGRYGTPGLGCNTITSLSSRDA